MDTDRSPIKTILLANWGPGAEILRAMTAHPRIEITLVVTRYDPFSSDKWLNAVYDLAEHNGLNVREESGISFDLLKDLIRREDIDLMVTHAFMRRLPPWVFRAPRLGSVNVHASLLPRYRGRSPVRAALTNRESESGLTSHYIDEGIDTGDIIHQEIFPISQGDSAASILERQKAFIPDLIHKTIERLSDPAFKPRPQESIPRALNVLR